MIDRLDPRAHYDQLCESLGEPITTAMELCALPHWFDDGLACAILDRFVNLNGDAQSVLAELKRLPFVYPYETRGWRFTSSARAHFASRLAARNHKYLELSSFLKDYFGDVRAKMLAPDSPEARETEWRFAYHLAPIDAKAAIECLHRLNEQAAERYRLADMRAVVDLTNEQSRWLSAYIVDTLYFAGCYSYAQGDFKSAEARFATVWKQAEPSKMKAIAGHLLGIIWVRNKQAHGWILKAREIFQDSLELLEQLGDTDGQAMVLNSWRRDIISEKKAGQPYSAEEILSFDRIKRAMISRVLDRTEELWQEEQLIGIEQMNEAIADEWQKVKKTVRLSPVAREAFRKYLERTISERIDKLMKEDRTELESLGVVKKSL